MFVKNITEVAKPLYELLNKGEKFSWTEKYDEAFRSLKSEWENSLELVIPDFNKVFTLETDASNVGIGAVLKQDDSPIGYVSRSLSNTERNYSITERETLAALWEWKSFHIF
jgi:hypothetical protein